MKALVTGGAGFIGSCLTRELLARGYTVTALDARPEAEWAGVPAAVTKAPLSITADLSLLQRQCRGVDYVFHLAAVVGNTQCALNSLESNRVNVEGTLRALIAAQGAKVRKLIFASSAAVYGDNSSPAPCLPQREIASGTKSPLTLYALTKIAGERSCEVFRLLHSLPTICLRLFNVYGSGQNPAYAAVVESFASKVRQELPLVIEGDGEQTRDFVYVKDVVRACILAAESDCEGIYNVGSGQSTSVNQLAETILKIGGRSLHTEHVEPRPEDIRRSLADITKAREFGYEPQYTLEQGLREMMES